MIVDHNNKENEGKILYCVYGVDCFPTIFSCKIHYINTFGYGNIIWGYSVYKGEAGFRTLGREVDSWINELKEKYGWDLFLFFDDFDEAMKYIKKQIKPNARELCSN